MNLFIRIVPALFVFVALSPGCRQAEKPASAPASPPAAAHAQTPPPKTEPADSGRKAAVEAALQRYSDLVRRMDDEAISETYTDDGEMGSVGTKPLKGRAAILRRLGRLHDYRVQSETVTSESVSFEGNEAVQRGTYHQIVLSPSKKTIDARGRLEAVWTLEADGVWRLKKMTAFPDKPEQTAKPKG